MVAFQSKNKNLSLLLYGKNILVSGVNNKSAQAIALGLAAEGANLIIADKERVILSDLAETINVSYGLQVLTFSLDLSYDRDEPYNKLVKSINAKGYKHLDGVIVLNSYTDSYSLSNRNIMNYPTPMWKDVIQINLDGVFILVKTLLPFLLNAKSPSLIFSMLEDANLLQTKNIAYGVANYGINGFFKLLAAEMETSHLSVSGVNLGPNFYNNYGGTQVKKIVVAIPQIMATQSRKYHNKIIDLTDI